MIKVGQIYKTDSGIYVVTRTWRRACCAGCMDIK